MLLLVHVQFHYRDAAEVTITIANSIISRYLNYRYYRSALHYVEISKKLLHLHEVPMGSNQYLVWHIRSHIFCTVLPPIGRFQNSGFITLTKVFEALCTPVGPLKEQHIPHHWCGCQKACKRNTIDYVVIIFTVKFPYQSYCNVASYNTANFRSLLVCNFECHCLGTGICLSGPQRSRYETKSSFVSSPLHIWLSLPANWWALWPQTEQINHHGTMV